MRKCQVLALMLVLLAVAAVAEPYKEKDTSRLLTGKVMDQQENVLHLFPAAAVGQGALGMDAEFGGPVGRRGYSKHHEAANVIGNARSFPDIPVNVGIDDVLQRHAELA